MENPLEKTLMAETELIASFEKLTVQEVPIQWKIHKPIFRVLLRSPPKNFEKMQIMITWTDNSILLLDTLYGPSEYIGLQGSKYETLENMLQTISPGALIRALTEKLQNERSLN